MLRLILDRDWVLWEEDNNDSDQSATELKTGPPPDINRDEVLTQTEEPVPCTRVKTADRRKVRLKHVSL